jgi:hypothetical protein
MTRPLQTCRGLALQHFFHLSLINFRKIATLLQETDDVIHHGVKRKQLKDAKDEFHSIFLNTVA